jgi:hypothetical protein
VASPDGLLKAYQLGGRLYLGDTTGMSNQENSVAVDARYARPIGFLSNNRVLFTTTGRAGKAPTYGVLGGAGVGTHLAAIDVARASTDQGDLVAGSDAAGRGLVVSADTGATLWSSAQWAPWAFSPDGKYVAATNSPTGGDFSQVAILDARTMAVVAQHALLGNGLFLEGSPSFEDDTHLLFVGLQQRDQARAVLRLGVDGNLDRATAMIRPNGSDLTVTPIVLATEH